MKKILFILAISILSLNIFAQSQISWATSNSYQVSSPSEDWPGWMEAESPVLIYTDLGFGFIAIENGYRDRFIIKEVDGTFSNENSDIIRIKCIDRETKNCTIEITKFHNGNSALTVKYNNVWYSYLVLKENGFEGYPFGHFIDQGSASKNLQNKDL